MAAKGDVVDGESLGGCALGQHGGLVVCFADDLQMMMMSSTQMTSLQTLINDLTHHTPIPAIIDPMSTCLADTIIVDLAGLDIFLSPAYLHFATCINVHTFYLLAQVIG